MSISLHTAGLHSKYDPWSEAEKYLRHSSVSADSEIFLLIEPGKGYLTHLLHRLNPEAKLIELHCSAHIEPLDPQKPFTSSEWNPDSSQSLSGFLAAQIDDIDIGSVSVVEWPPAERIFGSTYTSIKSGVRNFLQERRATIHTTGQFGHLWLRNTIKRIAALPPLLVEPKLHTPIVIAASGPSLNRAIPLLQSFRRRFFLLALPSSISALRYAGLQPDMIVHSDPGFYANYHLRADGLYPDPGQPPIEAAPLYSSGYRRQTERFVLISTRTPTEEYFISQLGLRSVRLASHGTVAGLAFQLALELGRSEQAGNPLNGVPLIFAGLDFCYHDIIAHARPHSFDDLLFSRQCRLQPLPQIYYARSPRAQKDGRRQSYAHERYAAWFRQLALVYQTRVFRLFPSEVALPAFKPIDGDGFEQLLSPRRDKGSAEIRSADLQRIAAADRFGVLRRYSQSLRQQFEELADKELADKPGHLLENLKTYPLLMEFFQFTNYPLLFGIRRETVAPGELRSAFLQSMQATDSIIRAVRHE